MARFNLSFSTDWAFENKKRNLYIRLAEWNYRSLPHGKHQEDASPRGATQRALRTFSIMAQREAEESKTQGFFSGKKSWTWEGKTWTLPLKGAVAFLKNTLNTNVLLMHQILHQCGKPCISIQCCKASHLRLDKVWREMQSSMARVSCLCLPFAMAQRVQRVHHLCNAMNPVSNIKPDVVCRQSDVVLLWNATLKSLKHCKKPTLVA